MKKINKTYSKCPTQQTHALCFSNNQDSKMFNPLKNVSFTTLRQYMIRIRKQEKHRKVERDESVGNVTAVVRLPAPAAGAVSKTLKSLQSLHSLGDMYRITTVKVTAIWILLCSQREPSFQCQTYAVNTGVSYKQMCSFD